MESIYHASLTGDCKTQEDGLQKTNLLMKTRSTVINKKIKTIAVPFGNARKV